MTDSTLPSSTVSKMKKIPKLVPNLPRIIKLGFLMYRVITAAMMKETTTTRSNNSKLKQVPIFSFLIKKNPVFHHQTHQLFLGFGPHFLSILHFIKKRFATLNFELHILNQTLSKNSGFCFKFSGHSSFHIKFETFILLVHILYQFSHKKCQKIHTVCNFDFFLVHISLHVYTKYAKQFRVLTISHKKVCNF
ncbi:hypothetical protein RND81_07G055100 [Saponaria officinalis]|uniref:Uncharacterized protein n=1 Tax=Saponaria officinalis TaxID=3572 RepID=A0AAW1JKN8_SAPOF